MTHPSQYWILRTISTDAEVSNPLSHCFFGRTLSDVQAYFQALFPQYTQLTQLSTAQDRQIQQILLTQWSIPLSESNGDQSLALAGLCLRCYISHGIVQACTDLTQQFGERYGFTVGDLLPIVLTDDGRKWVYWDQAAQIQWESLGNTKPVVSSYRLFAVEILAKFNPKQTTSLNTWISRLTRCYPPLQESLRIEYGCLLRTAWSLLNGVRQYQRNTLSDRDRQILDVFHGVYRRDRRGKRNRCPEPSQAQLAEMLEHLSHRGIVFESAEALLQQLLIIADLIRQSLIHPISKSCLDQDLHSCESDNLMVFLEGHLIETLAEAIATEVTQMIDRVQTSRKYSQYTFSIIPALKLLYIQGKSQREIAKCLRMSNQSQVSRVLKLKQLLNGVRYRVVEKLLQFLLDDLNLDLKNIPQDINTFHQIIQHLEQYVDETVFKEAATEIRAGQHRRMGSLFAQKMRQFLEQYSRRR